MEDLSSTEVSLFWLLYHTMPTFLILSDCTDFQVWKSQQVRMSQFLVFRVRTKYCQLSKIALSMKIVFSWPSKSLYTMLPLDTSLGVSWFWSFSVGRYVITTVNYMRLYKCNHSVYLFYLTFVKQPRQRPIPACTCSDLPHSLFTRFTQPLYQSNHGVVCHNSFDVDKWG